MGGPSRPGNCTTHSPSPSSGSLLVARTWISGPARSICSIRSATACRMCSQLSRIKRLFRVRRCSSSKVSGRLSEAGRRRVPMRRSTSIDRLERVVKSAKTTPSSYNSAARCPRVNATLVLPTPPLPTRLTKRCCSMSAERRSRISSRPIRSVQRLGRLELLRWTCGRAMGLHSEIELVSLTGNRQDRTGIAGGSDEILRMFARCTRKLLSTTAPLGHTCSINS